MKFKKTLASVLCVAMFLLLLAGCGGNGGSGGSGGDSSGGDSSGGDSTEQIFNIKLAHGLADDHAVHIAMTAWSEEVREKSGGSINIEIVPNGTLGSETDCLNSITMGALEMAKVSASVLGNFEPEWNVVSVPYVFNDRDHYYKVMDGEIAQEMYGLTEKDGFIGLTWLESGARSFYTADKAIRTPADLTGLKIRTMDSQMAIDMMAALGGSAQVMGYSDIYSGMQTGVINGAENNVTALRDHKDVTKYYCFDEHTRIPDIIVISAKTWEQMSDNQKEIMKTTAAEMSDNYKTAWKDFEDEVLAMADNVELIRDVDIPAFQAACQSIYEKLKTNDPAVYAYVERIQAAA